MLGHLGAGVPIGPRVLGDPARLGAQLAEAYGRPGGEPVRCPLIGGELDRLVESWTGRA